MYHPSIVFRRNGKKLFIPTALILTVLFILASTVSIPTQERYTPPDGWAGKVVLAELFTGSECPPCLGADLGFEKLLEHFPGTVLAVLQYHEHIPLPDPMANSHTRERLDYYGARATPSVFIDGRFVGAGGGADAATERLYGIYRKKIEKQLTETPPIEITLDARLNDTMVEVSVVLSAGEDLENYRDLRLHIVLVEREIAYYGYSTLPIHQMVVRHMFGGSEGHPISFTGGTFSLDQEADLEEISNGLLEYLTGFEERNAGGVWSGFSELLHEIDPGNLRVIVFAQESRRNRVLQASVLDVK